MHTRPAITSANATSGEWVCAIAWNSGTVNKVPATPKLISKAQVDGMKAGAVIIDLAAEGGGNTEYSQPGETVRVGHVTIVAPLNVPSLLAEHASELYAKNLLNFVELIIKDGNLNLNWEDEVVAKAVLTHGGEIKNEAARKAVEGN